MRPSPDPISRERREENAAHFFVACLIAALAPIILYPGPPLPAALPALPAAALLCGRFIDHLFEDAERVSRPFTRTVLMLALIGSAGSFMLALLATRVREAAPDLRLLGSVLLVTSWAPFLANLLRRRRVAAVLMSLPVAFGTPIVTARVMPAMEGYLNARDIAQAMTSASPRLATLVLIEPPPPSLRLYVRRNLVTARPTLPSRSLEPALTDYRASDGATYFAFRPSREREIARGAHVPLEILLRTPGMVLARVRSQ